MTVIFSGEGDNRVRTEHVSLGRLSAQYGLVWSGADPGRDREARQVQYLLREPQIPHQGKRKRHECRMPK